MIDLQAVTSSSMQIKDGFLDVALTAFGGESAGCLTSGVITG
jgi:hypothetical protein